MLHLTGAFSALMILVKSATLQAPAMIACQFDTMPLMLMTFRGGVHESHNTLQIGDGLPIPLRIERGAMIAYHAGYELIVPLSVPNRVDIAMPDAEPLTLPGRCVSPLQP
jgi:hypothetical protein